MKFLFPVLGFGKSGGYRVLAKLADGLVDDGHQVTFLVNRYMAEPYFPTRAEIYSVDLRGRPAKPKRSLPAWFNGLANMWALYRAISDIESSYDGVIANHSLTAHPTLWGAGKRKTVYYIQAYEPEYYEVSRALKSRIYASIARHSYRLGLAHIVNSPIYISYKEISASVCVPPGFDPKCFFPPAERNDSSCDRVILGCIGRHEPHKGTLQVLRAFESLYESDPRYHLRVAYGNLPGGWSHPNVEVVVPANDRELGDFYRSLDVYIAGGTVQPGAYHYPVMEALACGTPVIHTGYAPGSFGNSWIIECGTAQAIALAVREMDWEVARRKSIQGINDVVPLSWPVVTKKFNGHLLEFLADK